MLPVVIFFSSVVSVLFYCGVMQYVIRKVAWVMQFTMATTAAESLNAAANIFLGQVRDVTDRLLIVALLLTLSPPILYTLPYWSNPPFLILDIRALWRSVLSARAPECPKLKMVGCTSMAKCKALTGSAVKLSLIHI